MERLTEATVRVYVTKDEAPYRRGLWDLPLERALEGVREGWARFAPRVETTPQPAREVR